MKSILIVTILLTLFSTIHSQTTYTISIPGLSSIGIPPSLGTQPYPNSNPISEPGFGRALPATSFSSIKSDVQYPGSLFVSPIQSPFEGIPQVDDSYKNIPLYQNPFRVQNLYGDYAPEVQTGNYGAEDGIAAFLKIRSRMLGLQRDIEKLNRDVARLNKIYDFNYI